MQGTPPCIGRAGWLQLCKWPSSWSNVCMEWMRGVTTRPVTEPGPALGTFGSWMWFISRWSSNTTGHEDCPRKNQPIENHQNSRYPWGIEDTRTIHRMLFGAFSLPYVCLHILYNIYCKYIYIFIDIYICVFLANGSNVTLYVYIHITVHITIPCRPHSKFWSLATTSKDGWLSHLCEMWHHSMWKLSPRKTSSVQPPRGCAGACVGKHATSEGALQRATSLQLRSGVVNGIPSEEGGSSVSWWEGFVQQISCNEETPPLLWTLSFREVHRFIWWHEWVCSIRSSSIWRVRSLQSTWRLSQSAYIDDAVMVWRHRGTRICHYSRWCVWWKTTSIHQRGLHLRCPLWLCSKIFKE